MSDSIVERNILTIVEPAIQLDPLEILDFESGSENSDEAALQQMDTRSKWTG